MNTFREGAASTENPFSCEEMISLFTYIGKISQEEMAEEARDIIVLGLNLELHTGDLEVRWLRSPKVLNILKHIPPETLAGLQSSS